MDALYWRATEAVDWTLINDLNASNQHITIETISFNFDPGFRIGVGYEDACWDTKLCYTSYYTKATDSASGNLRSSFLGSTLDLPSHNFFYQSGHINFAIRYNMFDWDFGKRFDVAQVLTLRPLLGLKLGRIDQTINTSFVGSVSATENINNNFKGIGPKAGLETRLAFFCKQGCQLSLIADFTTAYLWGRWEIKDVLNDNATPARTKIIDVDDKKFGSLTFQGLLGANLDYKNFSMKLGYEINDWFNQCQIFDDDTGGHSNDLILQGLTLSLSYSI